MILSGRTISKGRAEGKVLKLQGALSFLGGVDASTGEVKVENGGNVTDRILVFPRGKGSTVGSFVMYDLKVHGKAPAAVINSSAETIVATGAVISSIPMVDSVDVGLIKDGDEIIVDADVGTVEIKNVDPSKKDENDNSEMFENITEGYDVSIDKETADAWYILCKKSRTNKDKDAPKTMDLVVSKGSFYPISLTAKVSGITLTLRDISFGVSESQVTFDAKNCPGATIEDKR